MKKGAFVYSLAICVLLNSCEHTAVVTHKNDHYSELYRTGWRRTIGTDYQAGNNEYLYLDEFPMEWSAACGGCGYLYATEPQSNEIIWRFKGVSDGEAGQRAVKVKDGEKIVAVHETGGSYEIMVALQTMYYGKIFYRKLEATSKDSGGSSR